jgi:medium-chain acyl-[acyl-carrier-protein] hydrolase
VEALAKQIIPFLNKPFAFFGHSMGALISFEMARYLQRRKFNMPRLLLISAHRAPHLPYKHMKIHNASLQALEKRLRGLNGTPPEVFEQEELMTLVAPLVRADFAICETYQYEKQEPLKCPISVFGSLDDGEVNYAELCAWYTETPHPVTIRLYEGDHFYLQNKVEPFLAAVTEDLYRYLPLRF